MNRAAWKRGIRVRKITESSTREMRLELRRRRKQWREEDEHGFERHGFERHFKPNGPNLVMMMSY